MKKHRPKEFQLPDGRRIVCHSRTDFDILVREFIDNNIYAIPGIRIPEGGCVVDVGANVGFFVLQVNQLIKSGTVYAFEPIPATFDLLQENTRRHNKLDIRLFPCGLADASGVATFKFFPKTSVASTMDFQSTSESRWRARNFIHEEIKNMGGLLGKIASWTPMWFWFPVTETVRWYFQKGYPVDCQIRTLSEIIDEENIKRIDLLKVDAEGAEDLVLSGIRGEHWPLIRQAIIEVHDGEAMAEQIIGRLTQYGYETKSEPAMKGVDHLWLVSAVRA